MVVSVRAGGNSAPWIGNPPIPAMPVIGLVIFGSSFLSSAILGASLGCMKVVDDLIACSFKSSYRVGGQSFDSEEEISRLMLIRLGEGASGP